MRILASVVVLSVILAAIHSAPVRADTISGDVITIDATDPAAVRVEHKLTWNASAEARDGRELVFHLAGGVDVTGVTSGGADLSAKPSDVPHSRLRRWTVRLNTPIHPTDTREITVQTVIHPGDAPGIRLDAKGGVLAPGSGWFPAPALETDEILPHRTAFRLPAGMVGVAAGTGTGGAWGAGEAVRPFAAWGAWTRSDFRRGDVACVAYRDAAAGGDVPGLAELPDLLYAMDTGLGELPGDGSWTFVDVGRGMLAGGARTVLWDETAARESGPLFTRDLAGVLAESYWNDAMRFSGSLAGFLSRSFPLYLGDAVAVTLDESDQRYGTQARLIGPRRTAFVRNIAADRTLAGLLPSDPSADATFATRGVLVAHMMDVSARSGAHFMEFLRSLRDRYTGANVDDAVFRHELRERFGARVRNIDQFLDTTDVPDFILGDHELVTTKTGSARLKVQVRNEGKATDTARLSALSANGVEMYVAELPMGPGEERAVLLGSPGRIARVEVDTSQRSLQSALKDEVIELKVEDPKEEVRPAFEFNRAAHDMVWVTGLNLELAGASIHDFEGYAAWYETYHGPTGLLLMGEATVDIAPPAPNAESFQQTMGRDRVHFETPAIWVRFPVAEWAQVREKLMNAEPRPGEPSENEQTFMFAHSFPTRFADGLRAQVPPPGGCLIVLSLGGVERRAYFRDPMANGKVHARFWDQLRGETLWEDTR
jgi:hypothetical protein